MFGVPHRVVHDLESTFSVLLFICTHLDGPRSSFRDPPLFGSKQEHPSPMRDWLKPVSLSYLGHAKFSQMGCMFEDVILPHISPYFLPLKPHLIAFWRALHPCGSEGLPLRNHGRSCATAQEILAVFKDALDDEELTNEARESITLGKRSRAHPGDLVSGRNGWDPAVAKRPCFPDECDGPGSRKRGHKS